MDAFRHFLGSRLGLATMLAAAALGVYLLATHTGHVLAAVPYLILIACPLMHCSGITIMAPRTAPRRTRRPSADERRAA